MSDHKREPLMEAITKEDFVNSLRTFVNKNPIDPNSFFANFEGPIWLFYCNYARKVLQFFEAEANQAFPYDPHSTPYYFINYIFTQTNHSGQSPTEFPAAKLSAYAKNWDEYNSNKWRRKDFREIFASTAIINASVLAVCLPGKMSNAKVLVASFVPMGITLVGLCLVIYASNSRPAYNSTAAKIQQLSESENGKYGRGNPKALEELAKKLQEKEASENTSAPAVNKTSSTSNP